jgi:hypothetical protein
METVGQPQRAINHGWSLGMTLHRFQDDFGLGGVVGTPQFLGGRLRLTVGGGVAWMTNALGDDGRQEWVTYGHTRLTLESGMRIPGSPVRLYGFGGPSLLLLPSRLSHDSVAIGGYGGFGFEFQWAGPAGDGPVSYFVELGGFGSNAKADALPTSPSIGNGFLLTVGFRVYPSG